MIGSMAGGEDCKEHRFVVGVFFAPLGNTTLVAAKGDGPEPQPLNAQFRQIGLVFRSLRRFHPDARAVLLTDEQTSPPHMGDIEVMRFPVDLSRLMLSRARVQREFTSTLGNDEICLFLDGDMVVNRPLHPLLTMGGDVLLTWRRKRNFVNGGFIGVRGWRRAQGLAFFDQMIMTADEKFAHKSGWQCEQESLRTMFAEIKLQPEGTALHRFDGYEVQFLPGADWNWSPRKGRWVRMLRRVSGPYIIHFKGNGKWLMESYCQLQGEPATLRERAWVFGRMLGGAAADLVMAFWRSARSWARVQRANREG